MMKPFRRRPQIAPPEEGYILVWVVFLLSVFTIWLAVAVPRTAKEIQRDRELETINRGKQYIRAVQLYYKRFHAFPPNQNALVNTNEIRFLRKKYIDPTTGKDDWKPILFGQAKTQTLGFFGQPLAGAGSAGGSMMAGIGPSGNGGINGGSSVGSPGFGVSGLGGTSSSLSGSSIGGGSSIFSSADPGSASNQATSSTSSAGSPGTNLPTSSNGSSSANPSAQTFGGAGIVGFSPASPRQSILTYKKKNHYNEWEFVYDPILDSRTMSGNTGSIGQPASNTTNQIGSPGFNGNNNSFGPSSNSPSLSSPAQPSPASPQQ